MATRMPSLPAGFRFHPTDEELIVHYLMNQASAVPCPVPIIAEVNIYQSDPWDLPPKALFGETEWYFFSPRDRKYPNGTRPNRAAGSGYWKATGTDKAIVSAPTSENIGVKKALVFYRGKPPKGVKTDWIMHEYRLTVANNKSTRRRGSSSSMRLDDWVLCRIYKKSNNFQYFSDLQDQDGSSTVEEPDSSLNNNSMTTMNNGGAPSPKSEEAAHANGDGQQQFHDPGHLTTSMTKSCSLTDLLNTVDYSTLSQLLLDAPPAETDHRTQLQQSPLIYTTPAWQQPHNNYNNYSCNMNNTTTSVNMAQDYGASYNGLKRKRVMTTDGAAGSFDDGGSGLKRKLQLPSDSRTGGGFFFGSSSGSSYCNQQLAEPASTDSFQYSGLLSHPFLNQ